MKRTGRYQHWEGIREISRSQQEDIGQKPVRHRGKAAHMGSRKRSAQAKQIAAFKASLGGMDDIFEREQQLQQQHAEEHDEALRYKACESKNRYASRSEAEEARRDCEAHGTRGLSIYRCPYCNGWHLTSHHYDE